LLFHTALLNATLICIVLLLLLVVFVVVAAAALLLRPLFNRTRTWVWRSWVFAKKIKTWLYTLKQSVETNVFWWNNTVKRRTTTTQKSNENCSLLLPSPSLPSKRCLTSQA
jgi:hypothetical protein